MYTENLPDIFHLLEASAQSGMLTLTPAKDIAYSSWQATCLLQEGKLRALKICRTADGTLFLGDSAALHWLYQQKGVYWYFKELPPEALPTSVPRSVAREHMYSMQDTRPYRLNRPSVFGMESIPQRTSLGAQQGAALYEWSREHRIVFLLVDGTRSKADILRLLPAMYGSYIDQILIDLKSAGLIE